MEIKGIKTPKRMTQEVLKMKQTASVWNRTKIRSKFSEYCQYLLCIKVSVCRGGEGGDSKHTRIRNKQLTKQEPRRSRSSGLLLRVDCQSTTFLMNVMPPYIASDRHSQTPVTTDQSARRHNQQYLDLQQRRSENLKPRTVRWEFAVQWNGSGKGPLLNIRCVSETAGCYGLHGYDIWLITMKW